MNDQHQWDIAIALICLALLEMYALKLGIDGVLFGGVIALIAGIVGYKVQLVKGNPGS